MRTRRWYKGPTLSNQPLYSPLLQSSFHTTALWATECDRFFPRQFSRREPFRSPLLHLSHSLFLLPISLSPLWILDQQAAYKANIIIIFITTRVTEWKKKGKSDIFKYQPEIPVVDTRTGCQQVQASCLRGSVCHRGREGEESRTFQSLIDLKFHFLYATPQAGRGTARSNSAFT